MDKRVLVTLNNYSNSGGTVDGRKKIDDSERLKLVEVTVFETLMRAVFHFCAVTNVMCGDLCSRLQFKTHSKYRKIKIAVRTEKEVIDEVTKVAATV